MLQQKLWLLLRSQLLQVDAVEIDRFQQQRRETGIAHGVRNHAAGEREQDARRFGIRERVHLRFVQVAHADQPAIGQVDDERGAGLGARLDRDLQFDLAFFCEFGRISQ